MLLKLYHMYVLTSGLLSLLHGDYVTVYGVFSFKAGHLLLFKCCATVYNNLTILLNF